jgi:hypothetical protein
MLDDLPPEININTSTSVGYGNQIELLWHKGFIEPLVVTIGGYSNE